MYSECNQSVHIEGIGVNGDLCQHGDSGTLVLTMENIVIGMCEARSENDALVIPWQNVAEKLDLPPNLDVNHTNQIVSKNRSTAALLSKEDILVICLSIGGAVALVIIVVLGYKYKKIKDKFREYNNVPQSSAKKSGLTCHRVTNILANFCLYLQ